MSAGLNKAPRSDAPAKEATPAAKKRWKVRVNQPANSDAGAETHVPADRLQLASLQAQPLPYRQELEAQFAADLTAVRVYRGAQVDAALEAEGAEAAVCGDAVLLPANADKPLVAHEVAHILQQRAAGPRDPGNAAEAEALQAEARVAMDRPVPKLAQSLHPGAVAFRQASELEGVQLDAGSDREATQDFHQATAENAQPAPAADGDAGATDAAQAQTSGPSGEGALPAVDLGEPIPDEPAPTFEPAPMPEIEVEEADTAGAEAALAGAEDADQLMQAFKDAPPSVKALHHDQLEGEIGEMAAEDQAEFEAGLPIVEAAMSGTDDLAAPAPVLTPEAQETQLEDGQPAPPPEPAVDPTPDPGTANLNPSGNSLVSSWFTEGDATGLGRAFNNVRTGDNEVETSAGERPEVPLEGATDPQRVEDQDQAAREEATGSRRQATQAVLDGPGPEQVELQAVREEFQLQAREVPPIERAEGPVEGAAEFRDKELDTQVVALFDAHHNDSMAASMEEATAEVGTAIGTRDTERDAKVAETEAERDRLNTEADEAQRTEVGARRQEVQDARQTAVDAQAQHVADVETEADTQRDAAQAEIDTQVADTQGEIETQFAGAESEAEDELHAGEREAEEERQRQEREAEDLSWWERAANWVADQFDKLTKFINDVFDAVRAAVSAIIDAVKEAALALIDLAASAIIAAIEALGDALKAAVNALLAEHFPAVAAALNEAIDSAVEVATEAVNAVAEGLKAAVSALLDALAAGLDAILAACQAAVNAALAIARAALTGDWAALAKLILEPILLALGIQPEAFYEMISRAIEALGIIVDDPIGFLSNLVEAFVGGVRKFGSNLLTHLQQGIIAWLTGALGGDIQIPERFDLMGVLDLARQILGLTVDMIRRVAVRVLGEEAVERIEFFMGYVVELVTGGFSALWERLVADLGNLKDMVLDAIKTFLLERVIMAAITWLAGLFSPVGALVKLVMTIWNFMMFLKNQLMRIIEVVQRIVGTMFEIATGVLEPAMQGVENILARLLPIAIDLLARLLGLGNVANKVREIINNVRQRIEDAIVNLVNRVLSAFTGGRGTGATAGEDAAAGAGGGQIMAPISVRGGGESHTLSIEDQGETVVPIIRSTPQPLLAWLDARSGAPFEQLATERNWRGVVKTNKKTELEGLVARAREEESQLDRSAEATEDAINADPATAADEQQATQAEGEQTKRALEEILEFFGISGDVDLNAHFADDLARLDGDLQNRLRTTVLNRLDTRLYSTVEWTQARGMIAADAAIPGTWQRPAASGGVLRTVYDSDFRTGVYGIVNAAHPGRLGADGSSTEMDGFLASHLTQALNAPANSQAMIVAMLEGRGGGGAASAVSSVIREVAGNALANYLEHDWAFTAVTGNYYKNSLVPNIGTIIAGNFGKYYDDDAENTAGSGAGQDKPLSYFLGSSKRAAKNRTRLADSVRAADPGNHEWIPSSRAASVISATAARLGTDGETDALAGLAKLLKFQHEVRTPTSHLVFKPTADLSQLGRKVPYYSKAHADSGIALSAMTPEQRQQYYPAGGPQPGDEIIVLQAHAGGLDAGVVDGGSKARGERLQWASPEWHSKLAEEVDQPIADNIASNADGATIKSAILGYYRDTIWRGAVPLGGSGPRFDLYYTSSDGQWRDYEAMKTYAAAKFTEAETALTTDMNRVFP